MTEPDQAFILAAGLGTRMRPITDKIPKPLVEVAGQTLLDRALDACVDAGVTRATANVHYLADQIEDHLAERDDLSIAISDERAALLDSGGGVAKAISTFDQNTLFILNADSFWVDRERPALSQMREAWGHGSMDMLLLLAEKSNAVGFDGAGDFFMDKAGRLTRRGSADVAPLVYAGAIICRKALFHKNRPEKFSLNALFDEAIADGRLFGHVLDGLWLHVGTPAAIAEAEAAMAAFERS